MKFELFVKTHKYRHSNIIDFAKKPMPKRRDGFKSFEKWFCDEYGIDPL